MERDRLCRTRGTGVERGRLRRTRGADARRACEARIDELEPYRQRLIPGYATVAAEARKAGATAVALSGAGPSLVAFAPARHDQIAAAMQAGFMVNGLKSRTFVVPVDRQGVQVSVVEG